MLKRKATDQEGGPQAKGVPAADDKVNPIPRHLPEKSVTLHFTRRTWEEFAPGVLYYLPTTVGPKYMFNLQMKNQFLKFRGLWETMQIHTPKARISNLIFLQDDLRVQSSTPTDATAFTQVCYLVHFSPKAGQQYFKLADVTAKSTGAHKTLDYNLDPGIDRQFTIIGETQYTDFEHLMCLPAKVGTYAGWDPNQDSAPTKAPYAWTGAYISPTAGPNASCNLNVQYDETSPYFFDPAKCIAMATDMDSISFMKYGDTKELTMVTNLEGKHLYCAPINDPFYETTLSTTIGDDKVRYSTEWMYPGNNRPYICRCSNFDAKFSCTLHNKGYAAIQHHFFTMPPIKKPNGALLGQRVSCLVEQSISITFNFHESTFDEDEDISKETPQADLMKQTHSVYLRRGIYGDSVRGDVPPPPKKTGILCPYGVQECTISVCYNNFRGVMQLCCRRGLAVAQQVFTMIYDTKPVESTAANTLEWELEEVVTYTGLDTIFVGDKLVDLIKDYRIPLKNYFIHVKGDSGAWKTYIDPEGIKVSTCFVIESSPEVLCFEEDYTTDKPKEAWIKINFNALDEALASDTAVICKKSAGEAPELLHTNYVSKTKTIGVFFK